MNRGMDYGRLTAEATGQMSVAECGGEPQNQKWSMDSDGHISNAASKSCLDVQTCQTWITYQACNKTSACAKDGPFSLLFCN